MCTGCQKSFDFLAYMPNSCKNASRRGAEKSRGGLKKKAILRSCVEICNFPRLSLAAAAVAVDETCIEEEEEEQGSKLQNCIFLHRSPLPSSSTVNGLYYNILQTDNIESDGTLCLKLHLKLEM